MVAICLRGKINKCTGACGRISLTTTTPESANSMVAATFLFIILQNIQSICAPIFKYYTTDRAIFKSLSNTELVVVFLLKYPYRELLCAICLGVKCSLFLAVAATSA